jgi:antitoxin component HigA of HigAB toxin-antitoxin module
MELVQEFELRPIRNDNDLKRANEVAGRLAERGEENLNADEADYLDVLCGLIEDYEDARFPIAIDFTPADRLRARMEARGMTQAEVAKEANVSESAIRDLLSGKSALGKRPAARLAAYFGVPISVFLG